MGKWPRRKDTPHRVEQVQLEESLRSVRVQLGQAYANFNAAGDSQLVESYIYEIQALQARYSYLLRQYKALTGQALPPAEAPHRALPVA